MKHLLFALPVILLLAGSSCKKVDELTEFDITYSSQQAIPGSSVSIGGPVDFVTPDIETQSSSKFAANGTSRDLISAIKLTRLTITNQTGNLDFLKSYTIFIQADGLAEVQVASKSSIPAGATSVESDVTGANIKEFVFKDKIRFRISLVANSIPSSEQMLKLDETMRVSGKKLSK
jgi:hypothetical protein